MNFVGKNFVEGLGLKPCTRKHNHKVPDIAGAGGANVATYGVYHLRVELTDKWGISVETIRPFVAIDRAPTDSPILVGMPLLSELKMIIHCEDSTWEFERKIRCQTLSLHQLEKQLCREAKARVFSIQAVFKMEDEDVLSDDPVDLGALSAFPKFIREGYADVFDDRNANQLPPHRETDHAINLKEEYDPPNFAYRRCSPRELQATEYYINEALAKGIIRESTSPGGAPVIFAPKKDGTLRFCIDYRGLNAVTIKDRSPIPLIGEILDRLNGSRVFSKIDLKNAYYRIRIKEGDEWKTSFKTRYGLFEYLVMPFGLTNAPATFQAYINRALRGYIDDFCIVYLDDILIFSQDEAEHREHVEKVLERLRQNELYANAKKCDFFRDSVEFLGFIVDEQGIHMDPSRVEAIRGWLDHPPKTFRDIQVFLGFCNFYRRFIFDFAKHAKPLHTLLKGMKNGRKPGQVGEQWKGTQQEAFEALITAFTTAPVLRHYDPSLPLRLETDASDFAMAGILSQKHDQNWHPMAYFSRGFSPAENNYPTYDKEMLAIVMSFKQWRHYLDGAPEIEVWSDHENLKDFMAQTVINGRQARWLLFLAPYDFRIYYRKGALNPADGPSRRPDYQLGPELDKSPVGKLMPSLQAKVANLAMLMATESNGENISEMGPASLEELAQSLKADEEDSAKLCAHLTLQIPGQKAAQEAVDQAGPFDVEEPEELVALIRKMQEQDPFCIRVIKSFKKKREGQRADSGVDLTQSETQGEILPFGKQGDTSSARKRECATPRVAVRAGSPGLQPASDVGFVEDQAPAAGGPGRRMMTAFSADCSFAKRSVEGNDPNRRLALGPRGCDPKVHQVEGQGPETVKDGDGQRQQRSVGDGPGLIGALIRQGFRSKGEAQGYATVPRDSSIDSPNSVGPRSVEIAPRPTLAPPGRRGHSDDLQSAPREQKLLRVNELTQNDTVRFSPTRQEHTAQALAGTTEPFPSTSVRGKRFTIGQDGLLRADERIFVPSQESLKNALLRLFHDCPSAGHFGTAKTVELISRRFFWFGITEDTKAYVSSCPACQSKAVHHHKKYGKLEPLPPDGNQPFEHVSLDWITGLPESIRGKEAYDAVLTVVCRSTKYALFIPTKADATAVDFAELFFEKLETIWGTPKSAISDRDSKITSAFWAEVCDYKMLRRRLSTAFHPQTDGQSEALNRILEDYLRAYVTDEPVSWANLLPLAQFAYNNSHVAPIRCSPNYAMFGKTCEIRLFTSEDRPQGKTPSVRDRVEKLEEVRRACSDHIVQAGERMAKYYNRTHVPKQFKEGDWVKLSTANLKVKFRKIRPRWIGPFRITERIGAQAYRLSLPERYGRLHDVFPIQLLEQYNKRGDEKLTLPPLSLDDPENICEVEEVRDAEKFDGVQHYLVKWVGLPGECSTWEPIEHMKGAKGAIKEYEKKLGKRKTRPGGTGRGAPRKKRAG